MSPKEMLERMARKVDEHLTPTQTTVDKTMLRAIQAALRELVKHSKGVDEIETADVLVGNILTITELEL